MSSEKPRDVSTASVLQRQDFFGGVVVIAVAALAYWLGSDLAVGTLEGVGPGLLPKALSVLLGALGLILLVSSFWNAGDVLQAGTWRGPIFVFGALVVFGLTVRPLGLMVAGPLAMLLGANASNEIRWGATVLSVLLTTSFCIILFKFALGLAIPLAPWLLGY